MDSVRLGARVREIRERAALSQGDLAALVGLERTALSKIEGGSRKLTALELSDIASALGVRMSTILTEPTPALVSHRSSQGLDTADSKIDHLLASIAEDVEFVQRLLPNELTFSVVAEAGHNRPTSMTEAEALADAARELLGLNSVSPVHDLVDRVAGAGLLCFSQDLGVDTADAGTILLRDGAVSLINSRNRVGRRRLALAHEFGHFLIADDYTIDWRVSDSPTGDIEAYLDRFARALLLPRDGFEAAWAANQDRDVRDHAVLLASDFRVDMSTLARRLEELGLASRDVTSSIRGVATTKADIIEFGLFVPSDLEGTSLPAPFIRAVLRAFRQESISRERALQLLQGTFADDDLPEIRRRREDEIWKFTS